MNINDPDTLRIWIDVFFVIAAAAVALAVVALSIGIRAPHRHAV